MSDLHDQNPPDKSIDTLIEEALQKLRLSYNQEDSEELLEQRANISAELGMLYWQKNMLSPSRKYLIMALGAYSKLNDTFHIASIQGALGTIEVQTQNFPGGIDYLQKALVYWEKNKFINEQISCLQNIAIAFLHLHDENKAVDLVIQALNITMRIPDEQKFVESLQILLEYYEEQKKYDILKILKEKALEFWMKSGNKERQFKTLIDIGVISELLNEYGPALDIFKRAYNVAYELHDSKRIFLAQGFIGECHLKLKNLDDAKKSYVQTFMLAVHLNEKEEIDKFRLVLRTLGFSEEEIQKKQHEAQMNHN